MNTLGIENATAQSTNRAAGDIVTFACHEGYHASGASNFTAECGFDEQWNITHPEGCSRKIYIIHRIPGR